MANPHIQTLLSSFLGKWSKEPRSIQKLVSLPCGDQISLEVTTPKNWKSTVLLVHGLCGSHRSHYLVRIANRLKALGIRAVRMNLRGCGSGKGLAKQIYHSGRSEDVLAVLKVLKRERPESPITLVGYSLGGNIVLKLAGELGSRGKKYLRQVIAVSPPVDLHASVKMFAKPENGIYERKISEELRTYALELDENFEVPNKLNLAEFDVLFTAPRGGFESALDYYSKCSSEPHVPNIELPCRILFAVDDPLVCHSTLDTVQLPPNVQIFKTERGGHLGFLGNPLSRGRFRWLDSQIIEWIV